MNTYHRKHSIFNFGDWLIIVTLLALITFALLGCKTPTLETGGAYAPTNAVPDKALYAADVAYGTAYATVDFAFKFERDNRAMLWKISPTIKHTLDSIRPVAGDVNVRWALARQSYLLNPVPANLDTLNQIVARVTQLAATATAALPK